MSERRRDPLTGEWRMIASGPRERSSVAAVDHCAFCPTRPGGPPTEVPLPHFDLVVLEDRFPSLLREPPPPGIAGSELYQVAPSVGADEVVVYSDEHMLGIADMDVSHVDRLVEVWADRYAELGARDEVAYVLVSEDRVVGTGGTASHPHSRIQAYPDIPPRPALELETASAHLARHGTCVLCDVVGRERADGVRVIGQNRSFVAFVPFAARFPYEVHIGAQRHAASLLDLTDPERLALAQLLQAVVAGYDRLCGPGMSYRMSVHQAPTDEGQHQAVSHFRIELAAANGPAQRLGQLTGSELGGGAFVNHAAPETTAAQLRTALPSRSVCR